MSEQAEALRLIATDLVSLGRQTISAVAAFSGAQRGNIAAWLAGRPRVLSEENALAVVQALGWRYGRLRTDMVHRWEVGADLTRMRKVLLRDGGFAPEQFSIRRVENAYVGRLQGAVVISHLPSGVPGPDALVILVKRPLGMEPFEPITAQALGLGYDDPHPYFVSQEETDRWWLLPSFEKHTFPAALYWAECPLSWPREAGEGMSVTLTRQQMDWLELLHSLAARFKPQGVDLPSQLAYIVDDVLMQRRQW
jgi:hypothetical protein